MTRAKAVQLADDHRARIRLLSLAALILIITGLTLTGAVLAPA